MEVEKISRDICIIKYRSLPLSEYEKKSDTYLNYYPKIHSFYWLKLEKKKMKVLPNEISSLIKKLNIKNLIFLGEINQPWISKSTKSRKDFKPLIKAIEYFRNHKIEKKFNGGVKVELKELTTFICNFYMLTKCDGGFFDFNFIDENENFIFYIHYSGELKILTLNEDANIEFLKKITETNFIDSECESTNRIR